MLPTADIHHLLHSSTISVQGPHVAPSLYFIWWRKIELSMLIKSNSALMRQRLSNFAEHSQTTSLQLVPDAGDHVIERLTHTSSARPHTSTVTLSSFHFQVTSQEVLGKLMVKFTLHFEGALHSSVEKFKEPQKWWTGSVRVSFKSSLSLTPTQPDTQSIKYWLFQILCLFLVLGWQSKQLDCYGTTFHPDKTPFPTPKPLSAHTPTVLLSPCGGPSTLQRALCGSSSGASSSHSPAEQDRTCQCQANTCWRLGVCDFWFWVCELLIRSQVDNSMSIRSPDYWQINMNIAETNSHNVLYSKKWILSCTTFAKF